MAAIQWLAQSGTELLSSIGTPTWDLLTSLASDASLPVTLILPAASNSDFDRFVRETIRQFDLNPERVRFIPSITPGKLFKAERMNARDRFILDYADTIIPISLRPGSSLGKLLTSDLTTGKTIVESFTTSYEKRAVPIAYQIDPSSLDPELSHMTERYLVHWTRSFHHKWPDERQIEYYRDIIRSDTYPRSAYNTLLRIISTGTICASSKRMPARSPCVSFSSLAPVDLLPLISWRARFRQMAFEPYGIGIKKELADELNIRPVIYGSSAGPATPRWLQQSIGRFTDWRREKEHRHLGDFNLQDIPPDDLIAFVHTLDEAISLERATGLRTVPFVR
jgi:hypothetical protein